MPEEQPSPANATPPPEPPAEPKTDFQIGEEFGTTKKNLPPIKVVLIGVAAVAVVALIFGLSNRAHSQATGSIDDVTSVDVPGQNSVMVAVNVTVQNKGEKPYWIHTIGSELESGGNKYSDDAASPSDFERYFEGFPALKTHAISPLARETKIEPGGEAKGTVIFIFPVAMDAFTNRKSLKVTIQPYDQPVPLVLTSSPRDSEPR